MGQKSISDINNILKNLSVKELNSFIMEFNVDERQGVKKLVAKAQKMLEKYELELQRTYKMGEFERKYSDYEFICGIDEVGRGPLAGPVVAGAVILPKDCDILYLNDSKQLSAKKREELYEEIMEKAVAAKTVAAPQHPWRQRPARCARRRRKARRNYDAALGKRVVYAKGAAAAEKLNGWLGV